MVFPCAHGEQVVENQQYDEAVDISSSESVDEADVAPVPAPKAQIAAMKSGSATSGSGGGSAWDGGNSSGECNVMQAMQEPI